MSLFLAPFQCRNRQSSLSNDLSSKGVYESWCSFSDASVVHSGQVCRLPRESVCSASAALRGHMPFTFTLPGAPLELGLPLTPHLPSYLEFLPQWHTNCVPTSGTSQLLLSVWKCSSLTDLHECSLLLNERSAPRGLQRYFPWPPQIRYPCPPHLPHHSLSDLGLSFACHLLPLPPEEYKFC